MKCVIFQLKNSFNDEKNENFITDESKREKKMSFEILIQSIDGVMKIENSNHHHQKKKKQKKIMQIINFKGNDKIMSSSVFFPIKIKNPLLFVT